MGATLRFRDATLDDVPTLVALHNATAAALTARFGHGHWTSQATERGVANGFRQARVRIGRLGRRVVSALKLSFNKPWAIDVAYFTPVQRALYLSNMAVAVDVQRTGIGRLALDDARDVACEWPADAIRLDAYDAPAGAGGFYARCGYAERGRVEYRGTPLIYYETLVGG